MGFRFNLEAANWLAHVLAPAGVAAPPPPEGIQYGLQDFLDRLDHDFFAGPHHRRDLLHRLHEARQRLRHGAPIQWAIEPLREFFLEVRWCALLVPELGVGAPSWMSKVRTLRRMVAIRPDDPGLVLQVEGEFGDAVALTNVFPAVREAIRSAHRWPGVLLWTPTNDAAFLSIAADEERGLAQLEWVFSHLAVTAGMPDLGLLEDQYRREFRDVGSGRLLQLLHVSDLHLGSSEATRRLPRVQQLLATLTDSLSAGGAEVQAVVTGDLMDTPTEDNLDHVRAFLQFLERLTGSRPFVVLGNHDVRADGWLLPNLTQVMGIEVDRVRLLANSRVALIGFNSALGDSLARGRIGERGFHDAGSALDAAEAKGGALTKIAVLHHHPTPVERPDWHRRKWYERWLGESFELTDALQDSEAFLAWSKARGIAVALHGHKHIPRVDTVDGLTVVGCGSSVGKVETMDRVETYMSVNVVTVDLDRGAITCRLAAERIPGAGLRDELQHELVYRKQ